MIVCIVAIKSVSSCKLETDHSLLDNSKLCAVSFVLSLNYSLNKT